MRDTDPIAPVPGAVGAASAVDPRSYERWGPLTWGQQRVWFDRHLPPGRRTPSRALLDHCRVPRNTTLAQVRRAVTVLVRRHEALRTVVASRYPGQIVQRCPPGDLELATTTVDSVDPPTVRAVGAELLRPEIDVERAWPWRLRVVLHRGEPRAVVVAVDRVAVDGWALGVLLGELHSLLLAVRDGVEPEPVDEGSGCRIQPLDRAREEAGRADRVAVARWVELLSRAPANVLGPRRGGAPEDVVHSVSSVSGAAWRHVTDLADRPGVSAEAVTFAAVAQALAEHTGETTFLTSMVVSNRSRADLRHSVGAYALPVPVALDLGRARTFTEVVDHVAHRCREAYRRCTYSPARLGVAEAGVVAHRGAAARPMVHMNYFSWDRAYLVRPPTLVGEGRDREGVATTRAPGTCAGVYVYAVEEHDRLHVDVEVGDHLMSADQVRALVERVHDLLGRAAAGSAPAVGAVAPAPADAGWCRVRGGWTRPGDVARALGAHPAVRDVAVFVEPDDRGRPLLVAYLDLVEGTAGPEELRRHLVDQLATAPTVIVPDRWVRCAGAPDPSHRDDPAAWRNRYLPASRRARDTVPAPGAGHAATLVADAVRAAVASRFEVDLTASFAANGGSLLLVPDVVAAVRDAGFVGLEADELAGSTSLACLAGRLVPRQRPGPDDVATTHGDPT